MGQIKYFTLTQMIIDDLYFPQMAPKPDQLGGGVYAVAGSRIWCDDVGFCCLVGPDFAPRYSQWFRDNQVDVEAILKEKNTVHAKIQYFEDGEREEILLPGCGSHNEMLSRFTDIPPRYDGSKGMYFYAGLEERYWNEALDYLHRYSGVACWEINGSAAASRENRDAIADRLPEVELFSLNLTEGRRITGETDPLAVLKQLREMHASGVILRMGAKGALAAGSHGMWEIPAVPTTVVDVTGGGNSSTGGFLVGYCESGGDITCAARYAAVSASFIISQWSVPPRIDAGLQEEARRRLARLRVTRI